MICINTHIQAPPGIVFDLSRIQKALYENTMIQT